MKSRCCAVCGNGVSFVSWERAEPCSCGVYRAHTAVNEAVSGQRWHTLASQLRMAGFPLTEMQRYRRSLEVKLIVDNSIG